MANFSLSLVGLLDLVLVFLLLSLFLIVMRGRQSSQSSNSGQAVNLAWVYLVAGFILFFYGWSLDLVLQVVQLLLVGSIIYRIVKDGFYRS